MRLLLPNNKKAMRESNLTPRCHRVWFFLFVMSCLVTLTSCDDKDERKKTKEPVSADAGNQIPTNNQPIEPAANSGPGVSPDFCTQQNVAWIAAPGPNMPSACGGPLAPYKPCLEEVTKRYPAVKDAVNARHRELTLPPNSKVLYAVSENQGQLVMHYAKQEGSGFVYESIEFQSFKVEPSPNPASPACSKEHNQLPGLNGPVAPAGGETDGTNGTDGTDSADTGGTTFLR